MNSLPPIFRSALLLSSVFLVSCQVLTLFEPAPRPQPEPQPNPEVPQWVFSPPPPGQYDVRVGVQASAGSGLDVYLSVGGDPTQSGTLHNSVEWLGAAGATALNWTTPLGTGWDTVRSTSYLLSPQRPQAASGADHTLVIESGVVWAWGHGLNGQLGQGDIVSHGFADRVSVTLTESAVGVWASGDNSLVLDEQGSLWYFGYGAWLEGDTGYLRPATTPQRVALAEGRRAVTAGVSPYGGVWAVDQSGGLWVWGVHSTGASSTEIRTPEKALDGVALVAAGSSQILAWKSDGTLWRAGQDLAAWTSLGTWADVFALGTASDHSWFLTSSGDLWMWGSNGFGQLPGVSSETLDLATPTLVLHHVAAVAAQTRCTVVLPETGALQSWGEAPAPLPALTAADGVRALHLGSAHGLALTAGFHGLAVSPWNAVAFWGEHYQ